MNEIAINFLSSLRPEGPWVITAIGKSAIQTECFGPESKGELDEFLDQYNGSWNIYYSANPVIKAENKKASKENIRDVEYLFVDVDPADGEDIQIEQQRILAKFKASPPAPTFLVFSGGGYQALWRLKQPIKIDGDIHLASEAELYNIGLEQKFGGDHCHNVDRILRLPGTVNVPNAAKMNKGRRRADSAVVWNNENSYDLGEFPKGTLVPTQLGKVGPKTFKVPKVTQRVKLEDLDKFEVPDRVKIMIVQGRLDEPKQGDNSRSVWTFDCICNLIRCKVPDEMIYTILLDKDFGISYHCLDQKSPVRAAKRQIERGHKLVDSEEDESVNGKLLNRINEDYFFLTSQARICSTKRPTELVFHSSADFQTIFSNQYAESGQDQNGNPKMKKAGAWWIENPRRREYEDIEFNPAGTTEDIYNLWTGFAIKPVKGNCDLYLKHIKEIVCGGEESYYDYLIKWMARAVQKPELTGGVAIVIRGAQGTGKSYFVKQFGALFGRHYGAFAQSSHVTDKFNAHLELLCLMFCEEAFFAGDKRHESVLKALVTEETMQVERKFGTARTVPNRLSIVMASNEEWVVPAGQNERRYFVLEASNEKMQDLDYFTAMDDQMEDGGREALFEHLLNVDLEGFNVWSKPRTKGLLTQQELSLPPIEAWWLQCLKNGYVTDEGDWPHRLTNRKIFDCFLSCTSTAGRKISKDSFGRSLKSLAFFYDKRIWAERINEDTRKVEKKLLTGKEFPILSDAREQYEKVKGHKIEWPEESAFAPIVEGEDSPF